MALCALGGILTFILFLFAKDGVDKYKNKNQNVTQRREQQNKQTDKQTVCYITATLYVLVPVTLYELVPHILAYPFFFFEDSTSQQGAHMRGSWGWG